MKMKFAWKPDLPDQRDYTFGQLTLDKKYTTTTDLPTSVNLRKWCSEIEDQQTLGSCVANAVVGMFEYNRCRNGMGGKKFINFSRLFSYYNARILSDNVEEDSGTYIRDAIKSAKLNGICPATDWPYRIEYWKTQPPLKCYQSALPFKVSTYYRLSTLDDMRVNLANGHPFVFGAAVYQSFISNQVYNIGIVPMPSYNEKMLGGHAMMCIGYNDTTKQFLVRNSWGKKWGLKNDNLQGYCYFPYSYLENRNLSDDFWTAF